jgi:hypothetical protein
VSNAYEMRFTGPERWLRIVRMSDGQPVCTRGTEAFDDALHELNALAARVAELEAEVNRLREALEKIIGCGEDSWEVDVARAALEVKPDA